MSIATLSRRRLLKSAAAGAAGLVIVKQPASVWSFAANERLNIALVGAGGRGTWFVDAIPKIANLVALCDVNEARARQSYERLPDTPKFPDFRKMLDDMDKQIDAVVCATADHTHAIITMTAMKRGKHVFTEKPLTHNVKESRALREAAAKYKVATQMGNQGTSSEAFRRCVELIQAGSFGEISQVHVWNAVGGRGHTQAPTERPPVPPTLHWDLWLGPAAERPYHPYWLGWLYWRDFGTCMLGNFAPHTMNLTFMALKLNSLWYADGGDATREQRIIKVTAKVPQINRIGFPRWEIIHYDFPARGALPPLRLSWTNGYDAEGIRPMLEDLMGRPLDWVDTGQLAGKDFAGCLLIGSKAQLHTTSHNMQYTILKDRKPAEVDDAPRTLPRSPGHELEWLAACKGGPPAMSNFDYSGPLSEMNLLGNVATQFEGTLEFDPVHCKIVNNPAADAALGREVRKGWEL